jgi:hypothetical protein
VKCEGCGKEMKPRPIPVNGGKEFLPCEECEAKLKAELAKYPPQGKPKK